MQSDAQSLIYPSPRIENCCGKSSNSHFEQRKWKNADLPAHEVFDSLRSQRHRNRQTRGLPHIMRIAVEKVIAVATGDDTIFARNLGWFCNNLQYWDICFKRVRMLHFSSQN